MDEQRAQLLGPEPMDTSALGFGDKVPMSTAPPPLSTDQKLDKLIELLTLQASAPKPVYNKPRGKPSQGKNRFEFTKDGKPIFRFCSKPGHVWRECRQRLGQSPKALNN